ncbi:MAG: FtsX-like permease family protein [Phycisphaerales bacterium]
MIAYAFRHASRRWARSLLLCACVFVIAALPLVSRSVVSSFERSLRARAATAPLLVGAAGSRFDLVLSALHWRVADIAPTELSVVEEIRAEPGVVAIPVHARFRARGEPIAAVPFEYFEYRRLVPREGRLVAGLGEAVLGATTARRLGLGPGDDLPSDQDRSYDITGPSSVVLRVVGVLAETGTPDDAAVFVDLETAWLLEGIAHGHEAASQVTDPDKLIGRSDERVALSGAVVEHQRVDADNAASFHLHGSRDELPITAIIVIPGSDKASAIVRTRMNADPARQAISPAAVSEELIGSVLRVRRLVDAISVVVGVAMLGLLTLVALLTLRARSDEIRTLREVGASRTQVASLFLFEFLGLAAIGIVAALAAAWAAAGAADRLLLLFT